MVTSLAALTLVAGAGAAPGDLDLGFGSAGKVLTDLGSGFDGAMAVALQPDGKIVAAGMTSVRGSSALALVRYNADGSLDPGFGSGGKVVTELGLESDDVTRAARIEPDGKIVLTATRYGRDSVDIALVRYDADGSLDPGFGSGGEVLTDFGSGSEALASDAALQTDGKIVVAGTKFVVGDSDFALVRYKGDGRLDPDFGSGGKVFTDLGSGFDIANAIALQPDGKILAAGNSRAGGIFGFAVVRYEGDGSLDPGFGSAGKVLTDLRSLDGARAIALQPDGKIVTAGDGLAGSTLDFALVRYDTDGSLDRGFGSGGKVLTDFGSDDVPLAVALEPGGKIVAAGLSAGAAGLDFTLARYDTDGSLDPTFGSDGKVSTTFGPDTDEAVEDLAIQPDGKIVAAGGSTRIYTGDFALARYVGEALTARLEPPLLFQRTAGYRVAWSDPSGAAVSFDVRYRSAPRESGRFGPFVAWLTQTSATQAGFRGGFGRTTCFSVRAHDADGNTSGWSEERCSATPIDDGGLTQTGSWTLVYQHDSYLGHLLRATEVGSTLTTGTITGSRLALLASRQPGGGAIEVRWNGRLLLSANLNAATVRNRQLLALPAFAGNETGQLEIRVSAPGLVDIDGVGVWKQP